MPRPRRHDHELIVRLYGEGKRQTAIAKELGIPVGSVKNILHRKAPRELEPVEQVEPAAIEANP
jgi:DNA-directed RNA polymerase specialized sigma24 family protein